MKDVLKFELLVLIEKNKPTNEKKLNLEMEKQFSKNPQLRDIKLLQEIQFLCISSQSLANTCEKS